MRLMLLPLLFLPRAFYCFRCLSSEHQNKVPKWWSSQQYIKSQGNLRDFEKSLQQCHQDWCYTMLMKKHSNQKRTPATLFVAPSCSNGPAKEDDSVGREVLAQILLSPAANVDIIFFVAVDVKKWKHQMGVSNWVCVSMNSTCLLIYQQLSNFQEAQSTNKRLPKRLHRRHRSVPEAPDVGRLDGLVAGLLTKTVERLDVWTFGEKGGLGLDFEFEVVVFFFFKKDDGDRCHEKNQRKRGCSMWYGW